MEVIKLENMAHYRPDDMLMPADIFFLQVVVTRFFVGYHLVTFDFENIIDLI